MFSALRPAVEHALRSSEIEPSTHFMQLVRDELSGADSPVQNRQPEKKRLNELYELRSRYLDWELGTGYLGFFSNNAGTRYTFTRRMEIIYQMMPEMTSELRVLEIGCGAGLLCLDLAQNAKTVVGTDISFFVLDFANKMKEYVRYENVWFQSGDAEHLMFQDQTFDLVVCSEVLEHLISPESALAEIRRVVKDNGTVILSTPCAVSLSDITMSVFRLFRKQLESEKDVHFDKKTYLAAQRKGKRIPDTTCMRIHTRFRYKDLLNMFHHAGFEVEQAVGTVFAFPPHYQVFYRYCPGCVLPAIRLLEHLLNNMRLFQRCGSVTTCFHLKPL